MTTHLISEKVDKFVDEVLVRIILYGTLAYFAWAICGR